MLYEERRSDKWGTKRGRLKIKREKKKRENMRSENKWPQLKICSCPMQPVSFHVVYSLPWYLMLETQSLVVERVHKISLFLLLKILDSNHWSNKFVHTIWDIILFDVSNFYIIEAFEFFFIFQSFQFWVSFWFYLFIYKNHQGLKV